MNIRGALGELIYLGLVASLALTLDGFLGAQMRGANAQSQPDWFYPVWLVLIAMQVVVRLIQDAGSDEAERLRELLDEHRPDWPPPPQIKKEINRLIEETRNFHRANLAGVAVLLIMPMVALIFYVKPDWTTGAAWLTAGFFLVATALRYLMVRRGLFDSPGDSDSRKGREDRHPGEETE